MRITQEQLRVLYDQACLVMEVTSQQEYINNSSILVGMLVGFVDANRLEDEKNTVTAKGRKENFEVNNG